MASKRLNSPAQCALPAEGRWLNLPASARFELSSEDPAHPIESAFQLDGGSWWEAASPGEQAIRILFDAPQNIHRIYLVFHEQQEERTQELILRYIRNGGHIFRDFMRQEHHFNPPGAVHEIEDYAVSLTDVTALELVIVPDVRRVAAHASLDLLRIAATLTSDVG